MSFLRCRCPDEMGSRIGRLSQQAGGEYVFQRRPVGLSMRATSGTVVISCVRCEYTQQLTFSAEDGVRIEELPWVPVRN